MKKSLKFLIPLILFSHCMYAVGITITPNPTSTAQCPNPTEGNYTATKTGGGTLPNCTYTWTITGGTIVGSSSGWNQWIVKVKWNDQTGTGTLTVTTSGCTVSGENGSTKTNTYTRLSVFGQNFPSGVCNNSVDFPLCSTSAIIVCTDRMYVASTGGVGQPPLKEVDKYKWTIPSGWKETISNTTGPSEVHTTVNTISLQPLGPSGGTLVVKGSVSNSCFNTFDSNPKIITLTRSPAITISGPAGYLGPRCGLTGPTTFSVTEPSCATSYSWTIPAGWSGSSTTSSITVTPTGNSGGTLSVTIGLSVGGSVSASKDLNFIDNIPNPTISKSSTDEEICHGEEWTITCTPPSEYPTDYGFEWWADGGLLIDGVATSSSSPLATTSNTVTLSAPSGSYGSAYISVRLARSGCSPSNYVYFQTQVGTLSSSQFDISGPSTVCPNSTESYLSTYIDPSVTDYVWNVYGVTYQSGQGTPYLGVYIPPSFTSGTIILQLANRCGYTGSPAYINLYEDPYCGWYFASPNPANSKLTITAEGKGDKKLEDVTVDLIDKNSEVVRSGKFKSNKVEFDVSELSNGQYFIQITNGDKKSVKHVVIQH